MPKQRVSTTKARASSLVKTCVKHGFNQSAVANELGVTPQAVSDRLSKPATQDALQKYLDSPKLKNKLIKVAEGGLDASMLSRKGRKIADHKTRHKFFHDLMVATGGIKTDGNATGAKIVIVNYGHRADGNDTSIRTSEGREALQG